MCEDRKPKQEVIPIIQGSMDQEWTEQETSNLRCLLEGE
jgi:hypothetical protein